jgi:hypothetical protein
MDEMLHLQCDEVVACEPEDVWAGNDDGRYCAIPEPSATKMMALRREKGKCRHQTDHRKSDGILRKYANADSDSNTDPVPFFS